MALHRAINAAREGKRDETTTTTGRTTGGEAHSYDQIENRDRIRIKLQIRSLPRSIFRGRGRIKFENFN